jgi:hypothetical protein
MGEGTSPFRKTEVEKDLSGGGKSASTFQSFMYINRFVKYVSIMLNVMPTRLKAYPKSIVPFTIGNAL